MTPLQGYTVPRSELSGGTLVSRMVRRVVEALSHLDVQPVSAIYLLDSMCTISLLEASSKILKPFFHNRRAEILENMEAVRKICKMEEPHYVPGTLNTADLCTRGTARVEDVLPGSLWQSGPQFLVLGRDQWPVTRDFVRTDLPADEIKTGGHMIAACLRAEAVATIAAVKTVKPQLDSEAAEESIQRFEEILSYSNDFSSRIRVVARVKRGWNVGMVKEVNWSKQQVDMITIEPNRQELLDAEKLILKHGMIKTADAYQDGQLRSLLPFTRDGVIYTRGRLGEKSMESILGVSELPILMPSSRVAEL